MEIRGRRALEKVEADVDSEVLSPMARRLVPLPPTLNIQKRKSGYVYTCFQHICLQIDDFCFQIEWARFGLIPC